MYIQIKILSIQSIKQYNIYEYCLSRDGGDCIAPVAKNSTSKNYPKDILRNKTTFRNSIGPNTVFKTSRQLDIDFFKNIVKTQNFVSLPLSLPDHILLLLLLLCGFTVCKLRHQCLVVSFLNYCTYNQRVTILFLLYFHCQQSMLDIILTLCFFLSGTRFLGIKNHSSFRHAVYKHFCFTFFFSKLLLILRCFCI